MSVIISTALSIGFITFLIGFVGPVIFLPEANLGPLLGIFITGPLGFLTGGVIGFWRILINTERKITVIEWGLLLLLWLLMMVWYLTFFSFGPTGILLGTVCQLFVIAGTAKLYLKRCRKLKQPINPRLLLVLFAAFVIVGTEVFPPVTHPDWSRPYDGYLQNPPAAVFYWDSRLDSRYKVPQLAINRVRLMELWVWVLVLNAAALLMIKPNALADSDENKTS